MTAVLGVLNVTPDSFSDGGNFVDVDAAVAHARRLVADGADWIDVGGESTRPGATAVRIDEEIARVVPVIAQVSSFAKVSVDTRKADVARAAVGAGATMINDVSSSLMEVAAEVGVPWIAMHMRGEPGTMRSFARYDDVVDEVLAYLLDRAERARAIGVPVVYIDPGIGFAKTAVHNLTVLRALGRFVDSGFPVAIGTSRKRFLSLVSPWDKTPPPPTDRAEHSLATEAVAIEARVALLRVHDVRQTRQLITLFDASLGARAALGHHHGEDHR